MAATGHLIEQEFPIAAPPARVFDAITTPRGLDAWWTLTCSGTPALGAEYALGFGPDYQWTARVSACEPGRLFSFTMATPDNDWHGSLVRFELEGTDAGTTVRFAHAGWPERNTHFRVSAHCWALYLRLLRRYVELGEVVTYADRLSA